MSYLDDLRSRALNERQKRLAQLSIGVTDGAAPQTVMPIQREKQMPRFMAGREGGTAPGANAPQAMQGQQQFGPPMPPSFQVAGYTKGLRDAGPDAQAYADQFAGGDLSKVKARLMNIDGEMKNDYYTKGLLDMPAPDAGANTNATPQPDFLERLRMMFNFGGAS